MKRYFLCLFSISLLAVVLAAHGAPLMGTVTATTKDSITITDKAGKTITVMMENATKFLKDKKPAAMSDIQVGSRVVIDAHMDQKTKKYFAEEVQIGVAAADTKDTKTAKPAVKGSKKP